MKKLISLIFIALLAVVGCSSVTPAPEVIVTAIIPPGGIASDGQVTVSFENKNYVDAIFIRRTVTYTDTSSSTANVVENFDIAGYIPGGGIYQYTFSPSYPALNGMPGTRSLSVTFTGTDAYGYNKTFTATPKKTWY